MKAVLRVAIAGMSVLAAAGGLAQPVVQTPTVGDFQVKDVNVAEIDSFTEPVDGDELNQMVEEKLGPGWERIIRETSKKGNEQTLIFIHPEGERMGLFVLDKDGNEMDVVQVSVDPKHLDDDIGRDTHHHDGDDDSSDKGSPEGASN